MQYCLQNSLLCCCYYPILAENKPMRRIVMIASILLFSAGAWCHILTGELKGIIKGTVVDNPDGYGIAYAAVGLFRSDSVLINGMLCDSNGYFELVNVPYGNYHLMISSIGYADTTVQNIEISAQNNEIQLITIKLNRDIRSLEQVTILGQRPLLEYRNNKQVITVDQFPDAGNSTVAEILGRSASVVIDAQGNISLRGSQNFKVFIDGKPAMQEGTEALQSIPGSFAEKVEIITNPSAKYDSDSEAGIINVVMKKERYNGAGGQIELGAGFGNRGNYETHATLLFNFQQEKINYFLHLTGRFDTLFGDGHTKTHIVGNEYDYNKKREANELRNFYFGSVSTGIDYRLTRDNTATFQVSGSRRYVDYAAISRDEITEQYSGSNSAGELDYSSMGDYRQWQVSLEDKHLFHNNRHGIDLITDYGRAKNDRDNNRNYFLVAGEPEDKQLTDRTIFRQDETRQRWYNQLFFSFLTPDSSLMETGILYELYTRKNDFNQSQFDETIADTRVDYLFTVFNVFGNYSGRFKKFNYQVGTRIEASQMALTGVENRNLYAVYPAMSISWKLPGNFSARFSYSKRIRRPAVNELSPLISYSDDQATWTGNPKLKPAQIHALELGIGKKINTSTMGVDLFYRNVMNSWQNIAELGSANHFYYMPVNIRYEKVWGLEYVVNLVPGSKFRFSVSGSVFRQLITNDDLRGMLKQTGSKYKLSATYNLSPAFRVQIDGTYSGRDLRINGFEYENYFVDLALKKEFGKNFSLSFMVRDVMNSSRYRTKFSGTNAEGMEYVIRDHFDSSFPTFLLNLKYAVKSYREKPLIREYQVAD
jgi:outer membrane receptor protein involved in Fe transport